MRNGFLLTVVVLLTVLLGACVTPPPPTAQPVSPLPAPTKDASAALAASPLPAPTEIVVQPTRQPGTGSVTGIAYRLDGTPMKGITIYGALIETINGVRLAGVDPANDVRATTDAEGRFTLVNLKPGEYAIATQSPVGVIMPHNSKGEIVLYQVKADEQTDLGRLEIGFVYPDS